MRYKWAFVFAFVYTIRNGMKKQNKTKQNTKSLTANGLQQINISPNLFESVNFGHATNLSVTDAVFPIFMITNTLYFD